MESPGCCGQFRCICFCSPFTTESPRWRASCGGNAIVSVVMAIVFWFVCWTLGTATALVEALSLDPRRLVTVVPSGDTLIAVDQNDVLRWNDETGDWQQIFVGHEQQMPFMMPKRFVGPIYQPASQRILAFRAPLPGFGPWQARTRLLVGRRSEDWRREEGVSLPDAATNLFLTKQGDVLAVSSQGIFKLEGNWQAKQADVNVFGLHLPLPENGGRFAGIGAIPPLRPLESAALDFETGAVVLFDGHHLVVCEPDSSGQYRQTHDATFDRKLQGKVGIGDGKVFLAFRRGTATLHHRLETARSLEHRLARAAGRRDAVARRPLPGGPLARAAAVAVRLA